MDVTTLEVGDRVRARAGIAIMVSLGLAIVFALLTWWTKEVSTFEVRQPWQDDPFDVATSLDYAIIPGLVIAGALRVQLCRRNKPLPARRVADLLRLSLVVLLVVAATQASEWTAVALGLHRRQWNIDTVWQLAVLAALSAATVAAGTRVITATRALRARNWQGDQPDWLADAALLALRWARLLAWHPRSTYAAVRWVDTTFFSRIRTHPVGAAGVLSCALAVPFVLSKVLLEGYPPLLALLSFALPAAGLFAFITAAGRFLRIVPRRPSSVAIWPSVLVAGCAAGPVVFAFHDSLLSDPSPFAIDALLFGGGLVGALICLMVQLARRHHRHAHPAS
ncbi:hypothetical protein CVV68_22805 [Arthrobacter livingstonensis]|uniref:Uncharacterized protein n=1 Tax=Arthrobacter livingstonensis TaxID=670078 RepID=A0A2V5KZB4_9MICC|nr:hypothetical protein [Arthrobacter livingstonensis]PYI64008.1 hypothetical protein CVV68_22805 [Arthrobacter livingstonensis]